MYNRLGNDWNIEDKENAVPNLKYKDTESNLIEVDYDYKQKYDLKQKISNPLF